MTKCSITLANENGFGIGLGLDTISDYVFLIWCSNN